MNLSSDHSEPALLKRLAAGDVDAFQAIYDTYWSHVYGVALRLTKSPEQSRDLSQDIFVKLWTHREKAATINDIEKYLFTVSRNLVYDFLRREVFIESNRRFLQEYHGYEAPSPHDLVEIKSRHQALEEAIQSMPPRLQEVFRLHWMEGLSHDAVAQKLGISRVSSKTYIVRALAFLREKFAGPGKNF
ncbi:MAG TPA: sigma-70 family RNA polymerase sigma factor [Puia sp.]|nr:sigma-70 family RNA polymerase sigma factor [Puia sp.]